MKDQNPLETLQAIAQDPTLYLTQKKKKGIKIIGSPLADVPREIIHASGFLPVTILGTNQPIIKASAHLPDNACSLARSNLELVLNYATDRYDGYVFPQVCDTTQHLSDIWKMTIPSQFFASFLIPRQVDRPSAQHWFYEETGRLKQQLEKFSGRPIRDVALAESFHLYNENRRLLRALYQLKKDTPYLISNRQLFDCIRSFCFMDPRDHLPLLESYLDKLKKAPSTEGKPKRVVLSGITVEPGELFDILDELKVSVVGDDLIVGSRLIDYDVPDRKDPLEALTDRHFAQSPFSPIRDVGTRLYDHLLHLVEETQADGVIFFHIKFCESQDYDLPDLKQIMRERKIPMIVLETEYQTVAKAQTKTRLEAFIESIYGDQING